MKNGKLKLDELSIQSFITQEKELNKATIIGATGLTCTLTQVEIQKRGQADI